MKKIVVIGGGIGGLAAASLLGRAGHRVTLLEASDHLGGKSRRVVLDGQRMDTGPSLLTFPGVWEEFLRRYDALGEGAPATEVAGLKLRRAAEVGRYFYRDEAEFLPVEEGHPWRETWERFMEVHGGLGPEVTKLLTTDPLSKWILPSLGRLLRIYGTKLTARSYLDGLQWLPEGLREVIAIHTLNAGVSPSRAPALYASMPAVMANDGVWVPEGGMYEVVLSLKRLARTAGVGIRTGEPVERVEPGKIFTAAGEYAADAIVSDLDADRLEGLVSHDRKVRPKRLSCSGVAIYAALREELPAGVAEHNVMLPSEPEDLYGSLEAGREPQETMVFVNYYRPGGVYPNDRAMLALLLAAPANGREYGLDDSFASREIERVSREIGLPKPAVEYFSDYAVLHPRYFGGWGATGGALYGAIRPFWKSGPLHRPKYSERKRPWLWRVGASVHPGGGIPAVLGGAMISTSRLLEKLGERQGTA